MKGERPDAPAREWVARAFTRVEDAVYIGLGLLLAASALALLVNAGVVFARMVSDGGVGTRFINVLDQLLLVLMIVEVLYTVQVSFRQHALMPEPFLVVGLIAGIRRVLVLTAQMSELTEKNSANLRNAMLELALLTALILALVAALGIIRRRAPGAAAERS